MSNVNVIFKTGNKINSHEHLKTINEKDLKDVADLSKKCDFFYEKKEWSAFVESVNHFQGLLSKKKWVVDKTLSWVREILSWSEVDAVKGCGAQGADALLVLCDDAMTENLKKKCEAQGLLFVGDKRNLSGGLSIEYSHKLQTKNLKFEFYNNSNMLTFGQDL